MLPGQYKARIQNIYHLGLVAGMCKELDIDSFKWELDGELQGVNSLSKVEPDQDGSKQIEIDINGWKQVFITERYTGRQLFAQERYTIYVKRQRSSGGVLPPPPGYSGRLADRNSGEHRARSQRTFQRWPPEHNHHRDITDLTEIWHRGWWSQSSWKGIIRLR